MSAIDGCDSHRPVLIDSHCHFDFDVFDGQRELILESCHQAGIDALVIPAVEPARLPTLFSIANTFNQIYATAGLHPWWVEKWLTRSASAQLSTELALFLSHPRCVAVGECGLDAAIETPMEQQRVLFEQQLRLASEMNLPVIIHVRKAHNQVLELLRDIRPSRGGVIHGFSGSAELAQSYWRLGFYVGIGGVITYERANKTREAVKKMPLEMMLLETDAPDMPLSGRQGTANSPLHLPEIAHCLAALCEKPLADIAAQTTENSKCLFGI